MATGTLPPGSLRKAFSNDGTCGRSCSKKILWMRYSLNYPTNIKTDYYVKTAIRIAKIELNSLFYSPIAWLMLIVFFIQTSIAFSGVLSYWITVQELGGQYAESREFFTSKIFGTPGGIIGTIA